MSDRTVPFDPDAMCDVCSGKGAYDFMGDLLCPECASKRTVSRVQITSRQVCRHPKGLVEFSDRVAYKVEKLITTVELDATGWQAP